MAPQIPFSDLQRWREECVPRRDEFVHALPKIELHVHIEGTISPELRWKLAKRNAIPLRSIARNLDFNTLEDLKAAYVPRVHRLLGDGSAGSEQAVTFFDMFDEGLQVLQTEEDFYDLATDFFDQCHARNVRYVEPFFGPHSHRHRGIDPSVFMNGYRRAQLHAETELGVHCQWIMVINRSKSLDEAWENYRNVALKYKSMVVGIGVAGNEIGRPASLFDELLLQARNDGFKITAHCDVDIPNTHKHIRQVLTTVAGTGADRCDHGLNIADSEELLDLVKTQNIGLTLCPWGYAIYHSEHPLWKSFRKLRDSGVKIAVGSDDPPYMMHSYTEENLVLLKVAAGFSNEDLVQCQKNAVDMCWASPEIKDRLLGEILAHKTPIKAEQ